MPRRPVKVGKYEIVAKIAKGGMGAVFKAKHPTLNRFVILKQLTLKGGSGFIERFKREASLMLDFRDEHIVQVYDHFKEGSSYYIVMEYVDGTSLDKLISERRSLSNEAALLLLSEIAEALKHAHDKGVVHRDIKPANILISKTGQVKLTDFGIATTKEADDEGLTKAGMTLGTPAYMSPEQIADTRKVDKRADIYSLGVVFYEMITGTKPFPSSFTPQAINAINRGTYVKPRKINPTIPGLFKRIVKKTMNRKSKRRYRDLGDLLEILARFTRKYRDKGAISSDIKRYMAGEEVTFPTLFIFGGKSGRRGSYRLKLALALVAVAALLLTGVVFHFRGFFYDRFKGRELGSLEVRVAVPAKYPKDPGDIYARAELTPMDRREKGEKTSYRFRLHEPGENLLFQLQRFPDQLRGGSKTRGVLTTAARYLPAGEYTLDLYLETSKIRKTLFLDPRVVQKQGVKDTGGKIVEIALEQPSPRPVRIDHRVTDSRTGSSILSSAQISLYLESERTWVDWKRGGSSPRERAPLSEPLLSGKTYTFRYDAPLYYPKTVPVFVDRDVSDLLLDVSLVKQPGSLSVESDTAGLELLVDNRRESYLGIKEKDFLVFGRTVKGTREFVLPEGNYVLTVRRDGGQFANYQFTISANRRTALGVSYQPGAKRVVVRQKS